MTSILLERPSQTLVIIRLNRPEKLNAMTAEMFDSLSEHLNQLQNEPDLRALILTAVGDRAFCAGTDISELTSQDPTTISKRGQELCDQIEAFPVPVIAAVNGVAAGGGMELVLACHLRIASSSTATFSLPETKLALIPGYGGTQRLTRELGVGRALDLILTGKNLSSSEALEFGLLNRVVPSIDLLTEALSLAEVISQLSPLSIRACLRAVTEGLNLPMDEGLKLETELFASLFATEDAREGATAFLEKRPPVFKGR